MLINTILGSKEEMSQAFQGDVRTPVTRIKAGSCVVTQIKNEAKDGYWAVQLGFGEKSLKSLPKPQKGHLQGVLAKKAPRFLREVRLAEAPDLKVGDRIKVSDIFAVGDTVSVVGISKGKGFAGGVKRWGFAGGPKTHGQSDRWRAPGSIGQGTDPGRVWKGKKMAGRMGQRTTKIKGLKVVNVDAETDQMLVSGPVPGGKGTLILVSLVSKSRKPKENED